MLAAILRLFWRPNLRRIVFDRLIYQSVERDSDGIRAIWSFGFTVAMRFDEPKPTIIDAIDEVTP